MPALDFTPISDQGEPLMRYFGLVEVFGCDCICQDARPELSHVLKTCMEDEDIQACDLHPLPL